MRFRKLSSLRLRRPMLSSLRLRRPMLFILMLLFIEFLDELVFGARETAWPLVRSDLNLDYLQIGLLLSLPSLFANVIEMGFGVLADMGYRRRLILGGGVFFGISMLLTALSGSFVTLLLASCIFYPASGAFVSLSQAVLMDSDPKRHEQNMARWTFAGSLGVFAGPLLLNLLNQSWRGTYLVFTVLFLVAAVMMSRFTIQENRVETSHTSLRTGLREAFANLRRIAVVRWLVLLEFSNLLLDILYSYLALYMVDVVGVDLATASIAIAVWTGVGLLGDFLLIPLLERVRGLTYLRYSALAELLLYSAFLLVPNVIVKIIVLGLLGIFNAGWYSVLQGQLYSSMPGQSGSVLTLNNVFGMLGGILPFAVGAAAEAYGLNVAMWVLLLGPIALLIGIPRNAVDVPLADDD